MRGQNLRSLGLSGDMTIRGKPAERRVRSLATAIVAGTLSGSERAAAAREMQYNLALRAEVSSLRRRLHEVATLIPLEESLARQGAAQSLMERAALLVDKAREAAYSLGDSAQGSEHAAGGSLGGYRQNVAALCATGAAAASCVGAGVVGPGVAGLDWSTAEASVRSASRRLPLRRRAPRLLRPQCRSSPSSLPIRLTLPRMPRPSRSSPTSRRSANLASSRFRAAHRVRPAPVNSVRRAGEGAAVAVAPEEEERCF
jgi:hypothetical protein